MTAAELEGATTTTNNANNTDSVPETTSELVDDVAAIKEKLTDIASTPLNYTEPSEASVYYDAATMAPLSSLSLVRHDFYIHSGASPGPGACNKPPLFGTAG